VAARDHDNLTRAELVAQQWLATVAEQLGIEDQQQAYGVLRAWLHTVRDRLEVNSAADSAARLPLLLRGLFYDGWMPIRVPMKYDTEQFLVTSRTRRESRWLRPGRWPRPQRPWLGIAHLVRSIICWPSCRSRLVSSSSPSRRPVTGEGHRGAGSVTSGLGAS
jgi:hypothetical protein